MTHSAQHDPFRAAQNAQFANAVVAAARTAAEMARQRYQDTFKGVMGDDEDPGQLLDGYATAILCGGVAGAELTKLGLRIQFHPEWPDPYHGVEAICLSTSMDLISHKGTWLRHTSDGDTKQIDDDIRIGPLLIFRKH